MNIIQELQGLGLNPVPILVIAMVTEGIKKLFMSQILDYMENAKLKFLISSGVALVVSAIVSVAFCLPNFDVILYMRNLLIAWVLAGKIYDIFNKIFKK